VTVAQLGIKHLSLFGSTARRGRERNRILTCSSTAKDAQKLDGHGSSAVPYRQLHPT
jgi:hypothetical protein